VTVSVDLVNVGDEPATDVRATVTTSAGTTVQLIYDELQPGATGNNEVELRPTETGTQTVSVEATGAETDTVSRNETLLIASPGPGILPGQDAPATDPDGDGIYEDVTGNNRFEFLDVLALLFELDRIDPPDTDFVDVNDDGTVNFLDVVELLFELG
jgi:PKD repeat protein